MGCVRTVRVSAQGRGPDHAGADRSHQAVRGTVRFRTAVRHLGRR